MLSSYTHVIYSDIQPCLVTTDDERTEEEEGGQISFLCVFSRLKYIYIYMYRLYMSLVCRHLEKLKEHHPAPLPPTGSKHIGL